MLGEVLRFLCWGCRWLCVLFDVMHWAATGCPNRPLRMRLPYSRRGASLILRGRCRSERSANRRARMDASGCA